MRRVAKNAAMGVAFIQLAETAVRRHLLEHCRGTIRQAHIYRNNAQQTTQAALHDTLACATNAATPACLPNDCWAARDAQYTSRQTMLYVHTAWDNVLSTIQATKQTPTTASIC